MKRVAVRLYNAMLRAYRKRRVGVLEYLLRYLFGFKLTLAGISLLGGLLFCGMLAGTSLDIPVYQLFAALSSLILVSFVASLTIRPRLRLSGAWPEKTTAGETVRFEVQMHNEGRFAARDIGVRALFLPRFVRRAGEWTTEPSLARGGESLAGVSLTFDRRGAYRMPSLIAYSSFPFRIWRSGVRLKRRPYFPESVLALPRFHPLESIEVPAAARHQPGGIAMTSNVGESPEYIGSREYRPGDPVRHLDFRAWARLARPVVREYREEYYIRIALVLDTFVPAGTLERRLGYPNLEAAVSLCAALSDALSTGEYIIDLFAAGEDLHVFRSGRHLAHHENVMEILACVENSPSNPFAHLGPALLHELEEVSSAIFLFLGWDASRERLVAAAREAGCRTKVIVIAEERPADLPMPDERAGELLHFLTPDEVLSGEVRAL